MVFLRITIGDKSHCMHQNNFIKKLRAFCMFIALLINLYMFNILIIYMSKGNHIQVETFNLLLNYIYEIISATTNQFGLAFFFYVFSYNLSLISSIFRSTCFKI